MRRIWMAAGMLLALGCACAAQRGSGGHISGGGHSAFSASGRAFGPSSGPASTRTGSPMPAPRYGGPYRFAQPMRGTMPRSSAQPRSGFAPARSHYGTASAASNRRAAISRTYSAGHRDGRGPEYGHPGNHARIYVYNTAISPLGWWLGPYQYYPWLDADLSYDFWSDTGDADDAIAAASTGAGMVQDAEPQPWPSALAAEQDEDPNAPVGWTASQLDSGSPALTLVYKNGTTEQVANYAVSPSAVTVIDSGGVRSVPVADLDVAAMARINAQAGLALPQALQQ